MKKPKILFYDTETAPNLAYVWGRYEQTVIDMKKEWSLLSIAWKWQGDPVEVASCRTHSEERLCKIAHGLLSSADVLVAHNGDEFDYKKLTAKFLEYRLPPLKPPASVDTKKVAKRYFEYSSNSLNDLARSLKVGKKVKNPGFDMWLGCMAGKKWAWDLMEKYNKQDVVLLEKVYNKFLPWMHSHPNMSAVLHDSKDGCPKCGSKNIIKRGFRVTNVRRQQLWLCKACKGWFQSGMAK